MPSENTSSLRASLYPESLAPLSNTIFQEPPSAYRGAPFWSWNGVLTTERLREQLDAFQTMGLGGGHIHPRTGLHTPYLSEEFMAHVRDCLEYANSKGMKTWLYDEDRWPSGAAGGLVTCDESYRMRTLVLSPEPFSNNPAKLVNESQARYNRGSWKLLTLYAVTLKDRFLVNFRRVETPDQAGEGEDLWYAYGVISGNSPWFNHQAYLDTLNPRAVEKFRDVTHERYREVVGDAFGKSIHSMFTDEPQVVHQKLLDWSDQRKEVHLPWTDDLPDTYRAIWKEDLLDLLPELVFERQGPHPHPVRWRFRDHVAERFASAFADTLGRWCEDNGIGLTGHMMEEPSLESQSHSIIEAMRHYRSFQLPGIDMLCDSREVTTAKQAQSAVRQDGRPGMLSELYGVTNWDFNFAGHKRQGDWQAALGVTVRVHHLTWLCMGGNAKRDYPASMGPHVPWFTEYAPVEDHFARLNTILTRGEALCRIGVIHPIESFWFTRGPNGQCQAVLAEQEKRFSELAEGLLSNLLDFDYLSESRLLDQRVRVDGGLLSIGSMQYQTVIVPALITIRQNTLDILEKFQQAGGKVIWLAGAPGYLEAQPSQEPSRVSADGTCLPWSMGQLMEELEIFRELDALDHREQRPNDLIYQLRTEGDKRHLFVCCTRRTFPTREDHSRCHLRIRGDWSVILNDTQTGDRKSVFASHKDGWTEIPFPRYQAASLCVTLEPISAKQKVVLPYSEKTHQWKFAGRLPEPDNFSLEEPNVLPFTCAEWKLDGESTWQKADDLLEVTNQLRQYLNWPLNHGGVAQPWAEPVDDRRAIVHLRVTFSSSIALSGTSLALENLENSEVLLNDKVLPKNHLGWWVDRDIQTLPLPAMEAGQHCLEIHQKVTPVSTLEWMYLLGRFGVANTGARNRIVNLPQNLYWGDLTSQGLPFYGGNLSYEIQLSHAGGPLAIRLPYFTGIGVVVHWDGHKKGLIAYDPHIMDLGEPEAGMHKLSLTFLGCRINQFGPLHHAQPHTHWWGPPAWETRNENWSPVYQIKPQGILREPILLTR